MNPPCHFFSFLATTIYTSTWIAALCSEEQILRWDTCYVMLLGLTLMQFDLASLVFYFRAT
jgi:hypothetical protein